MILYIDTSGEHTTIAIAHNEQIIDTIQEAESREQSAKINGHIHNLLSRNKIELTDIEAISVCNGPGSYTGLRVGLATAKGICFGNNIPLILLNKIDIVAEEYKHLTSPYIVILSARIGESFAGIYQSSNTIIAPQHFLNENLNNLIEKHNISTIISENFEYISSKSINFINFSEKNVINLKMWVHLTNKRMDDKKWDDITYAEPFYLKPVHITQSKK